MTPQELDEYVKVREKTLLERYDNSLIRFGNLKALYQSSESENNNLSGRVRQLTTNNKTLTTRNKSLNQQLARARAERNIAQEDVTRFADVLCRLRQVSPEMSDLIDEITTKVNFERNMNK